MEVKAKHNVVQPTVGDGAWVDLQTDENGNLRTSSASGGTLTDAKETDPDALEASTNSLLRGILEALNQIVINTAGP